MCVCVACYCCSSWGVKMIECLNSTFVLPRPAPPRLAALHHITNVLGKWLSQLDVAIPYRLRERLVGYIAGYACSRAAVTALISFFLLLSLFLCSLLFVVHYSLCVAIGNAGSICSIFSVLPNTVVDKYCIHEEHNLN